MNKELIVKLVEAKIKKWEDELANSVDKLPPVMDIERASDAHKLLLLGEASRQLENLEKRRMEISQAIVEFVQKST